MKNAILLLLTLSFFACKNTINRDTNPSDILWVSGIQHECDSKSPTHCIQIQHADTPQIGKWNIWTDSIVNFIPEYGYMYKLKVSTSKLRKKNRSKQEIDFQYTSLKVLEKKRDPSIVLYNIWGLYSMHGEILNTSSQRPRIELNLSKDQVIGHVFCNQISGQVHVLNHRIEFSNLITTKMACRNLEYETDFLNILQNPLTFKSEKNQIILYNSKGNEVLRFKKLD